jgi:AcrR family transcriptional regulator
MTIASVARSWLGHSDTEKAMNTIVRQRHAMPRVGSLCQSLRDHAKVAHQNAILVAAESFIVEHGIKQTKMVDLADACGVAVGTLYNYFDGKEAVKQAIAMHRSERLAAELKEPFASDDPVEQLRQWAARVHGYIERYGELLLQLADETGKVHESSAWLSQFPHFDSVHRHLDELLQACAAAGRLRDDVSLTQLAWTIRALYQSMLLDWCKQPGSFSLATRGDALLTLLLNGATRTIHAQRCCIGLTHA